jgi:hypothetical protein
VAVEMKVVWRASDGKLKCCDFSRSALVGLALVLSEQPASVAHAPSTTSPPTSVAPQFHFTFMQLRRVATTIIALLPRASSRAVSPICALCSLSLSPQYSTTHTEYGPQ